MSNVCRIISSSTREIFPIRTVFKPASWQRKVNKSTAELEGAQTKTVASVCVNVLIACTKVVVFPVPGGPCTTATSIAPFICRTAAC